MFAEYGYQTISANTDGVVLHIPKYELHVVRHIYKQWEEITKFRLEETFYDLYVRRDVNNYVCRKTNGEVKIKGCFIPGGAEIKPLFEYDLPKNEKNGNYIPINGILKGFNKPIIAIALLQYYLAGISPEETIYNHTDIYDFCASQKVGKQFTNVLEYVERSLTTHGKSKRVKKLIKQKEVIDAVYEDTSVVNKKGVISVKKNKITDKIIIPAIYEEVEVPGKPYVHPKVNDVIINERKIQKTVRFYISRPEIREDGTLIGNSLKKEKLLVDGTYQRNDYAAGSFISMFNDFYHVNDFIDYNIDYDFYISTVYKEINKIGRMDK